jgi:hypothetical protein
MKQSKDWSRLRALVIRAALLQSDGCQRAAALLLDIDPSTICRTLARDNELLDAERVSEYEAARRRVFT